MERLTKWQPNGSLWFYTPVEACINRLAEYEDAEEQGQLMMRMNDRIKHIANFYGYDLQSRQCCEELAELIQAICKHSKMVDNDDFFVTTDTPEREHVLEEMADVQIMLEQMQYLLHISDADMDNAIEFKVKRQEKRLKELEESL